MDKCASCGSPILLGGVRAGGQRFCNAKCQQNAYILSVAQQVPPDVLERNAEELFRGNCPKCGGPGPNDVRKFHQVWSMLILTRWTSQQQVSCRACGIKRQLGAAAFSAVCGWWGIPWGLILTPVQVVRNIVEMCSGPGGPGPSQNLKKLVQLNLAYQLLAAAQKDATGVPPRTRQ